MNPHPQEAKNYQNPIYTAIRTILSDTRAYPTSLNYAVEYCKTALSISGEPLRIQCLYILVNITGWRHPEAKKIRDILRTYSN